MNTVAYRYMEFIAFEAGQYYASWWPEVDIEIEQYNCEDEVRDNEFCPFEERW